MERLEEAKAVFGKEILALEKTKEALGEDFLEILDTIVKCNGKVIVTGMGKPGHIAKKIAATMASLGTHAFCLHPAEALHGDLGMISENDVVIAISYSGESEEITRLLPNLKMIGAKIVAISGNKDSTLVKNSDMYQILPDFEEACHLGLAPTSSTTVELVYGDALAVVASSVYGFNDIDFGKYHPAGSLGKKLVTKVTDLMMTQMDIPSVKEGELLTDAIIEIGKKGLGVVSIIDNNGKLKGILTDGDIRRLIEKKIDVYGVIVDRIMNQNPLTIEKDTLAVNALKVMREHSINNLPVIDTEKTLIGTITLQMIVKAGILAG